MGWRATSRQVKGYLYSRRLGEALKNEKKGVQTVRLPEVDLSAAEADLLGGQMLHLDLCYGHLQRTSEVSNTNNQRCVFLQLLLSSFFPPNYSKIGNKRIRLSLNLFSNISVGS